MYSKAMKDRDTNHRSIITNIFPFQAKAHGFPPCAFAVSGEELYLEKMRNREKSLTFSAGHGIIGTPVGVFFYALQA